MTDAFSVGGVVRGSSGATFTESFGNVTKVGTGNGRVLEQGMWLQMRSTPLLPEVYTTGEIFDDDEYVMELLSPLPRPLVDTAVLGQRIIMALKPNIWVLPPENTLNVDAHLWKVEGLMRSANIGRDVVNKMLSAFDAVDWSSQRVGLTHGDPTFDNVMLRGSDIVLIDPIPSTPAVPDLRVVDAGKVLQSAYGFETARYGIEFHVDSETVQEAVLACLDEDEHLAARYWCAVHFLRALPYMKKEVRTDVVNCFASVVRDL